MCSSCGQTLIVEVRGRMCIVCDCLVGGYGCVHTFDIL